MPKTDTTKTQKLPKRVAGVKLSKPMRIRGGKLLAALKHPVVAPLALAAVAAGAVALKDNDRVRSAAGKARTKAGEAASGLGHGAAVIGSAVAAKASAGKRRVGEAYQHASEAYDASHGNGTGNGKPAKKPDQRSGRTASSGPSIAQ
ncbi:hypothetical protein [Sphingosinicella soli]|uniref:Uncharacterized protein n=1 Tax=Sphingosinicella soli TaxID=333708 RepID=A0A7W7AZN6_9SPHN|nr:hypothetical protein [Sphingosinicella soli]MBB4631321.1 hypothetical protein [Sphingosinicella soli]